MKLYEYFIGFDYTTPKSLHSLEVREVEVKECPKSYKGIYKTYRKEELNKLVNGWVFTTERNDSKVAELFKKSELYDVSILQRAIDIHNEKIAMLDTFIKSEETNEAQ